MEKNKNQEHYTLKIRKILRTASLGSNFIGSYYNKKEWQQAKLLVSQVGRYQVHNQLASQLPRSCQQLVIKLASYSGKATKNHYHYCLLALPNFISVFNKMLSYLSFLKQLQFLAEQSPNQTLRHFTSLISIFFVLKSQLAALCWPRGAIVKFKNRN